MQAIRLKTAHLQNPIGIDDRTPLLSLSTTASGAQGGMPTLEAVQAAILGGNT